MPSSSAPAFVPVLVVDSSPPMWSRSTDRCLTFSEYSFYASASLLSGASDAPTLRKMYAI